MGNHHEFQSLILSSSQGCSMSSSPCILPKSSFVVITMSGVIKSLWSSQDGGVNLTTKKYSNYQLCFASVCDAVEFYHYIIYLNYTVFCRCLNQLLRWINIQPNFLSALASFLVLTDTPLLVITHKLSLSNMTWTYHYPKSSWASFYSN